MERRRRQMQYFLNTLLKHEILINKNEVKKFLYDVKFDENFFESLPKGFSILQKMIDSEKEGLVSGIFSGITGFVKDKTKQYLNKGSNLNGEQDIKLNALKDTNKKTLDKLKKIRYNIDNIFDQINFDCKISANFSKNLLLLKGKDNPHLKYLHLIFQEIKEKEEHYNEFFVQEVYDKIDFAIMDYEEIDNAIVYNYEGDFLKRFQEAMEKTKNKSEFSEMRDKAKNEKDNYLNVLIKQIEDIHEKNKNVAKEVSEGVIKYLRNLEQFKEMVFNKYMK